VEKKLLTASPSPTSKVDQEDHRGGKGVEDVEDSITHTPATLEEPGSTVVTIPITPVKQDEEKDRRMKTLWASISNIVKTVAFTLEDDKKAGEIAATMDSIRSTITASSDLETVLEKVFRNTIGLQSKTSRVFKATHQSILFPAIFYLRSKVYGEEVGTMKDVRRADGWTIQIQLGSANSVTHTRWEQSLAAPGSPDHFEVQWEMRLTFDKAMEDLRACFLRIQDLKFSETMTSERKDQLLWILRGGGYIV